jgi:hypothetical protein
MYATASVLGWVAGAWLWHMRYSRELAWPGLLLEDMCSTESYPYVSVDLY